MQNVVLLVEDRSQFEEIGKQLMKEYDLKFHFFENCLQFIEFIISNYADLVIIDLAIARDRINYLIRILKRLQNDIRIVLLLTKDQVRHCSDILTLGVLSFQIKPISTDTAMQIIASTLNIRYPLN